jgi:hypothetical protein
MVQLGTYAIHRCEAGWTVLTPCDDPFEPPIRVAMVIAEPSRSIEPWLARELGRIVRAAGRKRRGVRCHTSSKRPRSASLLTPEA